MRTKRRSRSTPSPNDDGRCGEKDQQQFLVRIDLASLLKHPAIAGAALTDDELEGWLVRCGFQRQDEGWWQCNGDYLLLLTRSEITECRLCEREPALLSVG
jgi:hypothetical protein